ncbi:hypothetical protein D0Y83_00130 [Qipengyuania flava]|uniref:Uncharacterized protein n=1 Tax=Qipengyuania flava TaxID=192812 RepID=A0A5P6N9N0_9SPHN|nr:hypothetical protein [Qipengyuania flava]MAO80785.1 hypothetical protein [Nocardioides sp.]QFI61863.1 hypothetical protein D0Y83_00130 [Qipengyuania flava]
MKVETLVETYPRLYHMAHEGAWPAIKEHGLLSVEALLDLYGIEGEDRDRHFARHRPENVTITREGLPGAVLRDQKPMRDGALAKCLQDGLEPADWYRTLNSKSFFWLSRQRVWNLLGARAYRGRKQTVLTLDTKRLVVAYHDRILLSPMNSGSTIYRPLPRGKDTFKRIGDFPFDERRKAGRNPYGNVVELVVEGGAPDISQFVLAVHEAENDTVLGELWRSPEATDDDRP